MSTRKAIGLVQINNSFSGQNYFPYAVGGLQAYAQKHMTHPESVDFLLPVFKREDPDKAVEKLLESDVVFFSSYVWNIRISLEIVKRLKARKPEAVVILGGPQVPDHSEAFLKDNPLVDLVVHGEGEDTFKDILQVDLSDAKKRQWGDLKSVSYIQPDGSIRRNPNRERLKDLNSVPSPYIENTFAPLMKANPEERWIALWETNRGCPFSCAYCDWGSATQSRVFQFAMDRIKKEADWFAEHKVEFIFCADANFGMLQRDIEIAQYVAEIKRRTGYPHALSVQNTKNATERAYQVQKVLADAGLNKGVTLSMQSVDPQTLKNIKRANISSESYQELQRRFTRDQIETYTDIILGLPGETYETFLEGVSSVVANGQHNRIQFNNLSILPNAAMGSVAYQQEHGLKIVESEVINLHGSLQDVENEILERQQLVVATGTCPEEDWVKTRATAWACSFYYFNKVLQIPLLMLHNYFNVPFRDLISVFAAPDLSKYPVLENIRNFFENKARAIQGGDAEYCASREFLDIWWPTDELVLIDLVHSGKTGGFYQQAYLALKEFLEKNHYMVPPALLEDAVKLNAALLKKPFQKSDDEVTLRYNIWECYLSAKVGQNDPIFEEPRTYAIKKMDKTWENWNDWCREVVWWGNKKGAYLYNQVQVIDSKDGANRPKGAASVDKQLAGHF